MINGVTDINSIRNLRSMHSTGKRAIPKRDSCTYLDLYMLHKERDRLEQELRQIEKRKDVIQKRINEINLEMEAHEEKEAGLREAAAGNDGKRRAEDLKVMRLKY